MRKILFFIMMIMAVTADAEVDFNTYFDGRTLRVDYTFAGDSARQEIFLNGYASLDKWAGRRVNLDKLLLEGTGDITMRSTTDGKVIYCQSFSTHFQDWTAIKQAVSEKRAFEHVLLLPMPRESVTIEIRLFDLRQRPVAVMNHRFDPKDILIRNLSVSPVVPETRQLIHSGDSKDCIDIAVLAEGYTKEELPLFYEGAQRLIESLFAYEPFKSNRSKFNVVAVGACSEQSGISEPAKGIWKQTAAGTFFDFLYTPRLLGAPNLFRVNDLLAGVPYEHVLILANTATYGGCGVYNSYGITAALNPQAVQVTVHEFGHSFAGLGDEYFYDDSYIPYYYPDVEPWNENLTTLADFDRKWKDMLPKGAPVPTPAATVAKLDKNDITTVGVYEGGGYQSKGVYRPTINCRMRANNVEDFCPVCKRAISRVIDYHIRPMGK